MRGINRIENMFDVLNDLGSKYSDYIPKMSSEIVYHDPETLEQEMLAKSIVKKNDKSILLYMASLISIALFIYMIVNKGNITGIIIMFIFCGICVAMSIFNIKSKFEKTQIMIGKVADKHIVRNYERSTYRNRTAEVSVIPDGGEKIIYRNIRISIEDYEKVIEGSTVMVVNKGPYAGFMRDTMK